MLFSCQIRPSIHKRPIQESHNLGTVADGIGTKAGGTQTGSDTIFYGPENGLLVEAAGSNIRKRIGGSTNGRIAHRSVEEGNHLRTMEADFGILQIGRASCRERV